MKTNAHACITVFTFFVSLAIYSQNWKLKKADKQYNQLAYISAAEIYEEVANSGFESVELFQKLGNTNYFNAKYKEAKKWYGKLFELSQEVAPIYYLRYAQSLRAVGKDTLSKHWYDKFAANTGEQELTFDTASGYLDIIEQNSGRYTLEASSTINTAGIDFSGGSSNGKLLFASTQGLVASGTNRSNWDGLPYLDIYEAKIDSSGKLSEISKILGDVNTKFHESSAVITKDGQTMYFTRNNVTPGSKEAKKGVQHLKLYKATLIGGQWRGVEDLSINSDSYSNAHPALSPDEKYLYFVSNRIGSYGLTDLYRSMILQDGSLGQPENLGEEINTSGRESFPYIANDNVLYFSSDGHYGLGGYDVFYIKIEENGNYGNLLNVGRPVNSAYDDLGFSIGANKRGFVSSNRDSDLGYDDIYSFVETRPINDVFKSLLTGRVTDKNTGRPIAGATVKVLNQYNMLVHTLVTNSDGRYGAEVKYHVSYIIKATKPDYTGNDAFSKAEQEERVIDLVLEGDTFKVKTGDDIAKLLDIVIYFDLDKSNIRPDAQVELEKLITVLRDNPKIHIAVISHTDSRAGDAYNMVLSNRRAAATINYIISRGITRGRLTGRGFGETKLVNKCANGVFCSDAEHQLNRRSEFIVIEGDN